MTLLTGTVGSNGICLVTELNKFMLHWHVEFSATAQIGPCIGPLDSDLVKLILRLLKSSTFQGTAALLSAVASIGNEDQKPMGLLKVSACDISTACGSAQHGTGHYTYLPSE